MLEHDRQRTAENREHLASSCERHRDGDTSGDVLMAGDDEDRRDDGRERRIWRDGRTDVHPAERHELQRTADDDTSRDVAEDESRHRAGNERTMRLQLIEARSHTSDGAEDKDEQHLNCTEFHYVSLHR